MNRKANWQEYVCPISEIDFDVEPAVGWGDVIECSGCWGSHRAGIDVRMQEYYETPTGLEFGELRPPEPGAEDWWPLGARKCPECGDKSIEAMQDCTTCEGCGFVVATTGT